METLRLLPGITPFIITLIAKKNKHSCGFEVSRMNAKMVDDR